MTRWHTGLVRPATTVIAGFVAGLLVVTGLRVAPPAYAFWTDSTQGSQTLTAGTVPPPANASCNPPEGAEGIVVTWSAPAGVAPTGYQAVLTQTSGPGNPNWDTGPGTVQPGTTTLPATQNAVRFGVTPAFLESNTYAGTFELRTAVGSWTSAPRSWSWSLTFALGTITGSSCTATN
jgi:hypothetical protein